MKNFDFRIPYQAGILTLISFLPLFGFEIVRSGKNLTTSLAGLYVFTIIASTLVTLVFIYGFYVLGKEEKSEPLLLSSSISMIFSVLSSSYTIALIYIPSLESSPVLPIAVLIVAGAIEFFFSYSLFGLQDRFGKTAKNNAIWGIILGISYMTFFLAFIGLILLVPVYWMRVKLLKQASEE